MPKTPTAVPAKKLAHKTPPGGLSVIELFAIRELGNRARDWREHLPVGDDQPFDVLLRLSGTLNVSGGQTANVKTKPDVELVLAIIYDVLGPKGREKSFDALVKRLPEIATSADALDKLPLEARRLAKETVELLTVTKPQDRAGNVAGRIEVSRLPDPAKPKPYKGPASRR